MSPRAIVHTYEALDGSQVCLTQWSDGTIDVTTRPDSSELWSIPLERISTTVQGPLTERAS